MAAERRSTGEAYRPVLSDFAGQGAVFDGLMRSLREETFVHAYLISGLEGIGKRTLARLMAQYLLCQGKQKPCGVCSACQQVMSGNHPDLIIVTPGKPINPSVKADLKGIPVDEIRALIEMMSRHTYEGGRRVILIEHAEKMNANAQNALLKTLEEPMPGTVFLLLTDAPSLLLPTIVSRCRALKMHPWPDEVIRAVLKRQGVEETRAEEALHVSGGSIGRALAVAADEAYWKRRGEVLRDFFELEKRGDILRVSTAWKDRKEDAEELLDDIEDMVRSMLLVRLGQREKRALSGYPAAWQRFALEGGLEGFVSLSDAVAEARKLRGNQVTWQAVVERLLLRLMEEKSKWST